MSYFAPSKDFYMSTHAADEHAIEIEPTPRWVRVTFNGETIADSKRVLLLRESGHLPIYYFHPDDVATEFLEPTTHHTHCPYKGEASYWRVKVGQRAVDNAVWSYLDPISKSAAIKGYKAFYWHKMDAWYEEEEEVFVHARDPYKRVDVMPSSRHIRVVVNGQTVADSRRSHLLFETGLPTRYYLPQADVRMDLLEATEKQTRCPYKGVAGYWSARVGDGLIENVVWSYPAPIPECPKIKGLLCFFNEKVDIYVDSVLQERPQTPWS